MNRVIRTVLLTVLCCLVMILSFSVMLITVSADTDGNFYRTTASANCIYGYSLTDNGVWQTVLPPTCTEKGLKIYTGTQNADILIEKTQSYPESPHPYADNMNETYGYTVPGAAALRVVFSPSTAFEDGYDNLIIYDKNNNETGVYSGTALAGAAVTVPGDTLKMLLKTDGSSTEYGFAVESITPVFAETSHPYNNNADETYSISVEGAHKLVLYFSESTETEENFDIIGIYDNEDNLLGEYSGTQLSGQTVTVFGDSCRITFASDYSNTAYGFRIDNVEAYKTVMQYPEGTEQEIPALGHDITVYSAKEPDCTDYGWYEYEACSRCDYTTYKEIPALEHNEIPHEAKPADCTEDGWLEYVTCSRCSYTTYEAVSAYGHNIINHIPQEATCISVGWEAYETCSRCDYTTYEEIPVDADNHLSTKTVKTTEPTCSAVGYTAGVYCADCEKYVSGHREIGIDANAHKWDSGEITTVATCKVNGVKTYTCEHNSGHTYTENLGLNMNNRKNVKLKDATEPTCSAVGYTAGVYCADCEKYVSGHREIGIDTEAHKWDSGEITTVATCKLRGTKTYICLNNPDHTYTENLGFNLSNHVNTKDTEAVLPTCSDVGYTAGVYCNDCERYISGHNEIGINADNHKWNQGEITVSASCRETGIRTYTCEYDENHIYTEELGLNKNNHKNISLKEATAPTCSAVGFTAGVYCNDCREYISGHKEIATDTSAHHWDAGKLTIAATCKVSGIKTYTCQHNSAHTYTESLGTDASNHINTSYIAEINATCSSVGYTAGVYCNDCEKYVSGHKEIGMNTDNHKWNSGEITVAASCNVRGKKTYTCENNKEHTYTESLGFDVSNHVNIKASEQTAPTCSSPGYTEGLYCCDCQKYISGHNEIAKDLSAHINTKIVAEIPATSENVGYTSGIYCEDCQRFISGHIEIPKIEADFTDSENAKEAGGYIFVNCSFASEELLLQAGTGAVITDREGNALSSDNLPGTGMKLILSNGKQYTVIVSGDVDGDGAVSSSDARLVLRAAVGLEQYKENSNEYLAADVENNSNLSASDARRILRAAVGLEKLYIVKKDLL